MGASTHTVDALRRKAPSAQIDIAVGDFACARVRGSFSVVAIVFNCILDERGLATQLAIFENASRHLEPGGCLVIEAFVLRDEERDGRWTVMPRYVAENHAEVQMPRFDIETGILERTLVHLRPGGARFISVHDSYAGPDALDVMAHVNGMTKVARYSSWSRDPFTAHSSRHITATSGSDQYEPMAQSGGCVATHGWIVGAPESRQDQHPLRPPSDLRPA